MLEEIIEELRSVDLSDARRGIKYLKTKRYTFPVKALEALVNIAAKVKE